MVLDSQGDCPDSGTASISDWLGCACRARARIAEPRTIAAIRRVAAHGAIEKYHETITRFWLRLVARHLREDSPAAAFDDFLSGSPGLLDTGLVRRRYRPETLAGEQARREWVEPDLKRLSA